MNPGPDPLDPLELALLMEAAGDLADSEDEDTLPGGEAADGGGQDDEES
jgi:hypothetical protein